MKQLQIVHQETCENRGGGYYIILISLIILMIVPIISFAGDKVLYQKGSYKFTQKNANNLLELAEYIGGSRFSKKDRRALQAWSIVDFKT